MKAKSVRLTVYFVCRFSYYVLRSRMLFVCSEYVEQCSFVWTVSRLCRHTVTVSAYECAVKLFLRFIYVTPYFIIKASCVGEKKNFLWMYLQCIVILEMRISHACCILCLFNVHDTGRNMSPVLSSLTCCV